MYLPYRACFGTWIWASFWIYFGAYLPCTFQYRHFMSESVSDLTVPYEFVKIRRGVGSLIQTRTYRMRISIQDIVLN